LVAAALVGLAGLASIAAATAPFDPLPYVDPFIGTGGHGHTFPGPSLPFGMVQLSPDTRLDGWDGCSGYHFDDDRIFGFSHTHLSGTGISDYGDVLLLPASGPIRWTHSYGKAPGEGYGSRFRKASEHASAGYYRVDLDDYGTRVELTTTARVGIHRYTFPAGDAHVLLDLVHRDEVLDSSLRVVSDREVEGSRRSRAWAQDQRIFFVARFSRRVDPLLEVDGEERPGVREARGKSLRAALRFHAREGERVIVEVGLSGVSIAGARRNLDAESTGGDFDAARRAAESAWRAALGRIEVEGGTADERTVFYTALYHLLLQPNVFSDVDGAYRGLDGAAHPASGRDRYTVFSLWDTFRAAHPLYTLLEPRRTADFIRTFLAQADEGGYLPVWELAGNETMCMIGYHAVSVIADAWAKGIRDFDGRAALAAMRKSAEASRLGLDDYRRFGFVPGDRESESVSKTLEYAYDDWAIARFAREQGDEETARTYFARAQSWRNLLDPESGLMRPRLGGRFKSPFDPAEVDFNFTEANSWQYSFFVPQDVPGHIAAAGGDAAYIAKLDALFAAPATPSGRAQADITGLVGQYAHGNEPSHHMAYLYAFAGQAWKTQARVAELRRDMYAARPDGLVGNEDCGQMSAWYVLSALGFYSVTPGLPEYVIGTPLFARATLHLPNGADFTVERSGEGPFVRAATLDGRPFGRAFLRHAEITAGGTLRFAMSRTAEESWAAAASERPGSGMPTDVGPILPAPYVASGDPRFRGSTAVTLAGPAGARFRFTLDGSSPGPDSAVYESPIRLTETTVVRFRAERGGLSSAPQEASFHKLPDGLRVVRATAPHRQYAAGGDDALIDGVRGGDDFRTGEWLGYYGEDFDALIDLGAARELRRLAAGFLQDQNSWIFMPLSVTFETSLDGTSFEDAGSAANDVDERSPGALRKDFAVAFAARRARFVRVHAAAPRLCPAWHKGAGNRSFVFADEIVAE
jgi:predicted alpha-1,2-mannosidase